MPPVTEPAVTLRAVTAADLDTLFAHQFDADANAMAVVYLRDREAFYPHWALILADPAITASAVLLDGALVGHVTCFDQGGQDTVGYWIAKEHWGKGVGSCALQLLLEQVPRRPLHAQVARSNSRSLRVLERAGFRVTHYEYAEATERFPACEEALLVLK